MALTWFCSLGGHDHGSWAEHAGSKIWLVELLMIDELKSWYSDSIGKEAMLRRCSIREVETMEFLEASGSKAGGLLSAQVGLHESQLQSLDLQPLDSKWF